MPSKSFRPRAIGRDFVNSWNGGDICCELRAESNIPNLESVRARSSSLEFETFAIRCDLFGFGLLSSAQRERKRRWTPHARIELAASHYQSLAT